MQLSVSTQHLPIPNTHNDTLSPACFMHHAVSMLFAGAPSPSQSSASKPELDEQTKKYAEVVRSVNKALVGGSSQQLDVTKAFLAACPEVANGKLSELQTTLMARIHNYDKNRWQDDGAMLSAAS